MRGVEDEAPAAEGGGDAGEQHRRGRDEAERRKQQDVERQRGGDEQRRCSERRWPLADCGDAIALDPGDAPVSAQALQPAAPSPASSSATPTMTGNTPGPTCA